MLSIRGTNFEAATDGGNAAIENAPEVKVTEGLSSFLGQEITKSDRPELTSAKVIISGGISKQISLKNVNEITKNIDACRSRLKIGRQLQIVV